MNKIAKQIIVIRADLRNSKGQKIRTGKLIAQACHASLAVILDLGKFTANKKTQFELEIKDESALGIWLTERFTKICLSVDSEAELLGIYQAALNARLPVALITDAGNTEFNGVPTRTCLAIGPAWSDEIDVITGHLKLL